jgi:hypothetical protein
MTMKKEKEIPRNPAGRGNGSRRYFVVGAKPGQIVRFFPKHGEAVSSAARSSGAKPVPAVTEQEGRALLDALDEARQAAERLADTLERTHHLLQDSIREVREARHVAAWSNDLARTRASHEHKPA